MLSSLSEVQQNFELMCYTFLTVHYNVQDIETKLLMICCLKVQLEIRNDSMADAWKLKRCKIKAN